MSSSSEVGYQLFSKILNSKNYEIAVTIFNPYLKYQVIVPINTIQRIELTNDLDSFYPYCNIIMKDPAGRYTNQYTHFGEYLRLIIRPPSTNNKQHNKQKYIDLTFVINEHILKQFSTKQLTYELRCTYYISKNFGMHLNFATDKNNSPQSPYLLIKNILNKINYEIKEELPPCQNKIHFISDQNKTIKNYVLYCLMMACSQKDPPSYLYYHLIDKEPLIINRDFLLKQYDYQCNTELVLPNINGNTMLDNELIIFNVGTYSKTKSNFFFQVAALEDQWTYDTIKRKWICKQFKQNTYTDLLSIDTTDLKDIKSSFILENYDQSGVRLYSMNYEYNVYARLHDLQLGSNCLKFYVQGNILRDCGQIINIDCGDKNFFNMYGGYWQTFSVSHIIQGQKYTNVLNCYRTYNYNYRPNKS